MGIKAVEGFKGQREHLEVNYSAGGGGGTWLE